MEFGLLRQFCPGLGTADRLGRLPTGWDVCRLVGAFVLVNSEGALFVDGGHVRVKKTALRGGLTAAVAWPACILAQAQCAAWPPLPRPGRNEVAPEGPCVEPRAGPGPGQGRLELAALLPPQLCLSFRACRELHLLQEALCLLSLGPHPTPSVALGDSGWQYWFPFLGKEA